jgi:hypothetical protein
MSHYQIPINEIYGYKIVILYDIKAQILNHYEIKTKISCRQKTSKLVKKKKKTQLLLYLSGQTTDDDNIIS